jgi:hypothetical protein
VAVLMRAIFTIALDGFCNCTWRKFYSSWNCLTLFFCLLPDVCVIS